MKLLILGGTLYLGRHAVAAALARGHQVTLFNRGRSNPELFPEVERLKGDRAGDLSALDGRTWDAVIDPSGYLPRHVRASCERLEGSVGHYTFISSINVYADPTQAEIVEDAPLAPLPEGMPEEVTGETYGPYKALCEAEVATAFPGRSARVRAGLIFGPHDQTERSGYWPRRVSEGGEVLAPGRPERPVQLIDVRDLAEWLVRLAENGTEGAFNGTGPERPLSTGTFLAACREATGSDARLIWMDEAFLLEQKVGPYSELPLWVPERFHAFESVNVQRAIAAGLRYRPLVETLRDTFEWARQQALTAGRALVGDIRIPPALTRERETELLKLWRARPAVGAD